MPIKKLIQLSVIVAVMCTPKGVMAYEEVEGLVDLLNTDDAFIAIVDGRRISQRLIAFTASDAVWRDMDID